MFTRNFFYFSPTGTAAFRFVWTSTFGRHSTAKFEISNYQYVPFRRSGYVDFIKYANSSPGFCTTLWATLINYVFDRITRWIYGYKRKKHIDSEAFKIHPWPRSTLRTALWLCRIIFRFFEAHLLTAAGSSRSLAAAITLYVPRTHTLHRPVTTAVVIFRPTSRPISAVCPLPPPPPPPPPACPRRAPPLLTPPTGGPHYWRRSARSFVVPHRPSIHLTRVGLSHSFACYLARARPLTHPLFM